MQKRLIITGIAVVLISTTGYVSAQTTQQSGERQSLLSRLRDRSSAQQQLQTPDQQVAQTRGYQPGVTIPQQQQQQQRPAQPVYPQQPRYPAYPPQQVAPGTAGRTQQAPYNLQGRATPQAGTQQQRQQQAQQQNRAAESSHNASSSSSDDDQNRSSSSSRSSNDSDSNSRSSSRSSSSSSRSSDDSEKKTSKSSKKSDKDSDSKKSSSKSDSSSALEKIARKVDSDEKSDSDSKKSEKKEEPKKSEEEIAREKAHAAFLKAADEATTVVATFLKQANDGYYSKASDSLSPAIKKYFDSEISAVNGTEKAVLDELTDNGTITMVTYVNTTVRGEGAVVEAELGYADGHSTRRSFDLIKIDDDWKIVLPVKGIMNSSTPGTASTQPSAAPAPNAAERAAAANVAAHASAPPPTAEQAAANASLPLVLAPDANTSAPR